MVNGLKIHALFKGYKPKRNSSYIRTHDVMSILTKLPTVKPALTVRRHHIICRICLKTLGINLVMIGLLRWGLLNIYWMLYLVFKEGHRGVRGNWGQCLCFPPVLAGKECIGASIHVNNVCQCLLVQRQAVIVTADFITAGLTNPPLTMMIK